MIAMAEIVWDGQHYRHGGAPVAGVDAHFPSEMAHALAHSRDADAGTVAVQCVARYGDEATIFRLAAQLEAARPWAGRRPALAT